MIAAAMGGRSFIVVLLLTTVTMAGCETGDAACVEDQLTYNGHYGGDHSARADWYDVGPVVWNFFCTEEQGDLDDFRFALTLGDGQRFWSEPVEGMVHNRTPVPTYAYVSGSGRLGTVDEVGADADLVMGFYNWDPYWRGAQEACYRFYNEYSDTRGGRCYEPFFALWNGTDANMGAKNPIPPGRYVLEIYMRDARQEQTVIAVREFQQDATIDWYACEKWPTTGTRLQCDGTLESTEALTGSPWPDHAGNRAQAEN